MNSSRNGTNDKRDREVSEIDKLTKMIGKLAIQKYTFTTKIGNEDGPMVEIEKLEDVNTQDVVSWVQKFKNMKELSGYTDEQEQRYLKMLVGDKYTEIVSSTKSVNTKTKELIKLKYNENYLAKQMSTLDRLSVGKFESILEYSRKVNELVKEINHCLSESEKLTEREKETKFKQGLSTWMKIEYNRLSHLDKDERIRILETMEHERKENRRNIRSFEHNKSNK